MGREERGREGSRATLVRCFQTSSRLSNPVTAFKARGFGEKDDRDDDRDVDRDDGLARCDGARAEGRRGSAFDAQRVSRRQPPPFEQRNSQRLHQCPPGEVARHRRQKVRVRFYRFPLLQLGGSQRHGQDAHEHRRLSQREWRMRVTLRRRIKAFQRGERVRPRVFLLRRHVAAYNLIPPFHTQFNGLIVGKNGTVGWYKSIYAKYFSGMQFSKFPLDSQQLQISLGLNSVAHGPDSQTIQFVPSATSSVFMMRQGIEGQKGKVDSVSGWEIRDVSMEATGVPLI